MCLEGVKLKNKRYNFKIKVLEDEGLGEITPSLED